MSRLVFYTDRMIPKWAAGCAIGPIVLIRPAYRNDVGLLAHELIHRRQWCRTLGLHSLMYAISKRYRQASEVKAYREQLKHYPDDRSWRFAEFLATNYDLALTRDEAHRFAPRQPRAGDHQLGDLGPGAAILTGTA